MMCYYCITNVSTDEMLGGDLEMESDDEECDYDVSIVLDIHIYSRYIIVYSTVVK